MIVIAIRQEEKSDMEKINILFMQSQTYFGADSRIHALLMQNLDRAAAEVHVALNYGNHGEAISPSAREIELIPNLHIRRTQFGPSLNNRAFKNIISETIRNGIPAVFSMIGLAFYLRKNHIDVIHCTEKPRDAFYGFLLARITGAKCVIHLHVKADYWIRRIVRWAMGRADGLIAISDFVAESLRNMGFSSEKILVVKNGMDMTAWNPSIDGNAFRQEFNISPEMPLLAIVSRLFYWKGHTELIQALVKVKETEPKFRLLIIGEDDPRGFPGRGLYSAELKTLVKELDLEDQIIFTGFRSDVPAIMAACDLFTMPSFEEPFGMVFTEAMAMRKPVAALNNGGTPEVVEDGVTGLLSDPKDIDQLAQNILTLVQSPALRKQMGENGRKRVEECFSPKQMAENMLRAYQMILEKPTRLMNQTGKQKDMINP